MIKIIHQIKIVEIIIIMSERLWRFTFIGKQISISMIMYSYIIKRFILFV